MVLAFEEKTAWFGIALHAAWMMGSCRGASIALHEISIEVHSHTLLAFRQ